MASASFVISHCQFSTQLTLLSLKLHQIAPTINLKEWSRGTFKWTPSWDFVFKNRKVPMGEVGKLACLGSASL